MNKLTKYGGICILTMIIIEVVILFGFKDPDGVIGASIINISTLFGIGMAFIIRGKQEEKFRRGSLPMDQ